jgi:nicotinate-nucleotide adenylyltransferase
MPKPSYTIDTLIRLQEKHPNYEFKLIIGGDNLAQFPNWKNADKILNTLACMFIQDQTLNRVT